MEQVQLSTATIPYRDTGGDGPVIVFLHGLLVDGQLWRKVTPHLEAQARCVVPDLPLGAHRVPAPHADLSVPGVATLVAEFMEALDLRDVTLVGNDTGGAIAQTVAVDHPERLARLVLTPCDSHDNFLPKIFTPLVLAAKTPRLSYYAFQPLKLRAARRLPIAFGWLTKRPVSPREVEDGWIAQFFSDAAIRADAFRALKAVDNRYTRDAAERLKTFAKPTLIAWAPEDKVFPFRLGEQLARDIPGARLERIEDSYTFVSEDQPERTAELIRAFIAG
jgi:pimeloyl-ACP methyl ester carboxylesterase